MKTPTKRRLAGTPTPGKTRRMNTTSIMSTPNTTLRSAYGGLVCQSPVLRPPLSASKVGLALRTPGRGRTPLGLERNKENISHLGATLRSMAASPQRNYSINSVASTYSEFARELSSASKSGVKKGSLNSTVTHWPLKRLLSAWPFEWPACLWKENVSCLHVSAEWKCT